MPPPTYRFHPDAVAEAEEARDWYAQRSPRAALDFLKELDRAIDAVLDAPEQWPESADGDRRYVLQRFPFLLVYSYVDNIVEFLAVAVHREPPLPLPDRAGGTRALSGPGLWRRLCRIRVVAPLLAVPIALALWAFWVEPAGLRNEDHALAPVPADAPTLLFTHNPDLFPEVPRRVTLTIAGHTHGGQVYLPGIGRPVVPSDYGERYAIGHIVENDRHLFVSSGLGTSILPVRFLVPPEVSVLRLSSGEKDRRLER